MATSLAYLASVQKMLTRYGMSTYVAFGNIGNLLAIAVFIQPEQRRNACSLYLLTMTVFNICCLNVGIIPIIYTLDYYDITTATLLGCQMQFYFRHVFFQMLRTAKALSCMDRYAICSSNVRFRALSHPKVAIYVMIGCFISWSLIIIFFSWIRSVQNNSCNIFNETYAMIYTIYYMMVSGVIPPLMMTIFSVLVLKNLRSLRRRIQPGRRNEVENHPPIRIVRKRDRDLMKMIFIEVMFYVITTLPFSVYLVYKLITDSLVKSQQRKQIETFINYFLQSFMLYFNTAVPFYIYVATSPAFRRELKRVFIKLYAGMTGKQIRDEQHTRGMTTIARP
ncbi:unnamed protein product [Rotaria sp. Silwood2]|nr:unnamed protein product [Rotaria sp. Silwood2]